MKKILLRFRDTSDHDTIGEHSALIKSKGYVWWGWWKKDSEPDRTDTVKSIVDKPNDFIFYIFDRSTNRFFKANVIALETRGAERFSSPDAENTPKYYNSERLTLWLKLSNIQDVSKADFLEAFGVIPNQDFTFFTENDLQSEVSKVQAADKKRIKLKSDYILHLSDIHFGDDFGFPKTPGPNKRPLRDIIVDYVKHDLKQQIGLLVVSGDITSRGKSEVLLTEGLEFLRQLCNDLKLKPEEVIIIPGNHDLPLQEAEFITYHHETLYKNFLTLFYGKETDTFGVDFFKLPCGRKVDILRINSVKLRKKEESNYGYVGWFNYRNLLGTTDLDGDLKIAVIHHHLVSGSTEEILDSSYPYGSISVTIDSGRVIDGLQDYGFNIVLNGHQHIPGITRISRGQKDDSNEIILDNKSMLTILSAGSAGAKIERLSDELKYNSFSIYHISQDSLDVEAKFFSPSIEPKRHYVSTMSIS